MNIDHLRDFIKANRESFDDATPGIHIWQGIEERLPDQQAKRLLIWKWAAAAAVGLLLIASGVIIGMSATGDQYPDQMALKEYQETEKYYVTQVNEKLQEVQRQHNDPTLQEDLRKLDEIYEELKIELTNSENPNKSEIINAMIINYQTKVAILEMVLDRLEEAKNTTQNEINHEI